MSVSLRFLGALLLTVQISWAQNPADISFRLSTRNGQTKFRQGEPVPVELSFQSSTPQRYQAITDVSQRVYLFSPRVYDRFVAEPATLVADPLREQTRMAAVLTGAPPRMVMSMVRSAFGSVLRKLIA